MIGIALGVMVLITVLSVMNGFDREIKKRVFSMVPPITLSSIHGYYCRLARFTKRLEPNSSMSLHTAPFVTGEVLLNYSGSVQPALIIWYFARGRKKVSEVADKMMEGN